MKLTQDQIRNIYEAGETKKFKPGDKFVMINRGTNINKEFKKDEIFTINKIEQNTLFFTKSRQNKNRYFTDESQLICKL